jgi:hypothetical protein
MTIQKASFHLPQGFLAAFGYRKGKRFVGLYWEPSGDEACYHDGEWGACGCCDNWLFLDFIRKPEVRQWLDENGINLGNSDEAAEHWLIVDALTGEIHAVPHHEAKPLLRLQRLPE